MPLKAFEEFTEPPLAFPVSGKTYTCAPVSYQDGLRLQELVTGDLKATPAEQWRMLMGGAYDEMVADNVPIKALDRACLAALVDYRMGREAAEAAWESGLTPEALAPKGANPETTQQPSTESENPTPSPASTRHTTSPKGSSKKRAAKATPSPKSASSGD